MNFNLTQHFLNYFTIEVADNPSLVQEALKIRYQVYCQEFFYEPAEKFRDGMEQDIYDQSNSIHFLVRHNPSNLYAGCVRIVYQKQGNIEQKFPFEKICSSWIDFNEESRQRFCEVSRLAVISEFRRRTGESQSPAGSNFLDKKRNFSVITLSLCWISIIFALRYDKDIIAFMEERLSRNLRRYGIRSHQVGGFVDYNGERAPFLIKPEELINNNLDDYINGLNDFVIFLKSIPII